MKDYYKVLGVDKSADADQIKSAFRSQARKLHPDVNDDPEAGKKFSELNEAYEVLSDAQKKAKYDQLGHERYVSGRPAEYTSSQNVDFGDLGSIIDAMFGGGGRGGRSSAGFGGFGGGGHSRARQPVRGQDIRVGLNVTLGDVHEGANKRITVPSSDGSNKSIEVKIPKGVKSGGKLRLKGQGLSSPMPNGPSGDLYVMIHVEQDTRYSRIDDGLDLIVELPLNIAEATLGAKVEVPTIDGKVVSLSVPAGTMSESKFRIPGHGLASAKGKNGDLFAKVRIVPPSGAQLTDTLRMALEDLKEQSTNESNAQG
ncbi:MAG: DnaJ C-terminal domain-containing protein [Phycisphaerales bacterium]|nr:DnaJ C-terminal domain-containing protein [Phycisphaerales bacterium]